MSAHLDWQQLCDYWAFDLSLAEQDALEVHAMGCEACSALSARVAAITETLRTLLPPVLDEAALAKLRARGVRVRENPMHPDERRAVVFPADADVLVHRLGGLALADVLQVDLQMRVEETGAVLMAVEAVPFERASDSVLLACQKHYASLPPNVVVELRIQRADGEQTRAYTIHHRFALQAG